MIEYINDYGVLKKYNDKNYKLVLHKTYKVAGFEDDIDRRQNERGMVHDEKLESSISRSKSKIYEYCLCNAFEYFVTLTIDSKKFDRYNLSVFYKKFSQWLRDYQNKHGIKIDYIFIPEVHSDGAWHLHGLIKGIPDSFFTVNEHGYLDWLDYRERFGYISLDKIRDLSRVSAYMTKYITKDMSNTIKELNAKTYYCSKGLKKAEIIKTGKVSMNDIQADFENDYVKIFNTTNEENLAQVFYN